MKYQDKILVFVFLLFFTIISVAGSSTAFAQKKFPTEPISIIVPYEPGSGLDMEVRGIIPYVEKRLGVRMIVINIPGAQAKLGTTKAWKAKPDGYTLAALGNPAPIVIEKMFDAEYKTKGFSHIYAWSISNSALYVNSETWKTFEEFLNAARKKTLSCAVSGWGSVSHLAGLALADELGFQIRWIPYAGGAGVLSALAGRHVDFVLNFIPSTVPLVKAGKIRPLLVLADSHDFYPGIPIPKDMGYKIDALPAIRGVAAPPNTPSDRIKILESAFAKAVDDPEYLEWARKRQIATLPLNAKQFTQKTLEMYKVLEKYAEMIKSYAGSENK